jgi:cell division protein FtsB
VGKEHSATNDKLREENEELREKNARLRKELEKNDSAIGE